MKDDRHKGKAKKNGSYKKQHGLDSSEGKGKKSKTKGGKRQYGNDPTLPTSQHDEKLIIRKQGVIPSKSRSFVKRTITECSWSRYEDFIVEDADKDEPIITRGADFQTLISQSGGAAAQLRMKDEKWDEDTKTDDKESEVGDLFKVDFRDVADCLRAVPLNVRLGIPAKYFEEEVLNRINADAARHALRVKQRLDEELSLQAIRDNDLTEDHSGTRECNSRGQSIFSERDGSVTNESKSETSESKRTEWTDSSSRQSSDVQFDERDSPLPVERISSVIEGVDRMSVGHSKMAEETIREDKESTATINVTQPDKSSEDVPSSTPCQDEVGDLEDWLNECLQSD